MSINSVCLSGYLGSEPRIAITQNTSRKYAQISVSVKIGKDWKFVPLIAWDNENGKGTASYIEQYFHAKEYVAITAHVTVNERITQNGKKYNEVNLTIDSIEKARSEAAQPQAQPTQQYNNQYNGYNEINNDGLPF